MGFSADEPYGIIRIHFGHGAPFPVPTPNNEPLHVDSTSTAITCLRHFNYNISLTVTRWHSINQGDMGFNMFVENRNLHLFPPPKSRWNGL